MPSNIQNFGVKTIANEIDVYKILEDREERTTVMVRNIPNKFK